MIIVQASSRHGNTPKVAKRIASVLDCWVLDLKDFHPEDFKKEDIIGFSSGVYLGRVDSKLEEMIKSLPRCEKKVFLITTSGIPIKLLNNAHKRIKKIFEEKGWEVIGEFNCPGYDDIGPTKLIGGIRKGRPSEEDLHKAAQFAEKLKSDYRI